MDKRLFTSESVTEGHPDKMCDQISDAILDALLEQDPMSRVACETATTTGLVLVMGEITTKAYVDIQKIVRDTVREIGYTRGKYGFDADTCGVITAIDEQSTDIAMGVDKALEAKENQMSDEEIEAIGAGDQNGAGHTGQIGGELAAEVTDAAQDAINVGGLNQGLDLINHLIAGSHVYASGGVGIGFTVLMQRDPLLKILDQNISLHFVELICRPSDGA